MELDVLRPDTIEPAIRGADVVYYLVHSMAEGEAGFEERDRVAASSFAIAAKEAGVGRVVYLGGLGAQADQLSAHLASRHETGRILADLGPKLIEFRAGMVIGAGSASFRMLMDLVKRLPVMITPRWVETRSQPIAIGDVVAYLDGARTLELSEQHTIVEIGGAEVLSYREMMGRAAAFRGRHPAIITVPVLTPRLSSLWCGLVTSVPTADRPAAHRRPAERDGGSWTMPRPGCSPTSTRWGSMRRWRRRSARMRTHRDRDEAGLRDSDRIAPPVWRGDS